MYEQVSVLVPTRKRLGRLRTLIESFERTRSGRPELVFRADEDDLETVDFLAAYRTVVGPRYDGYDSMPKFFNELLQASNGDVLMCGNDDMVFKTVGWDEKILEAADQYPDGLFDLGVKTFNVTHFPFSVVSRSAAERLGFLWDPRIFWGDIYLRDVMAAFGRTQLLPEVEVEHDWAGYFPDETFTQADKNITQRIPNYWHEVHATAVAEAVAKLRATL